MIESIHFSCQGESHKATNKVCQDYSYSKIYEDNIVVAIVCDGHGGKRYFRSDIGARLAAEITERNLLQFLRNVGNDLISNKPFTSSGSIATQISLQQFEKTDDITKALRQLFSSIIYEWNTQVSNHALAHPITEDEKNILESHWIEEFNRGESLEKVYGCTLMCFARTDKIWLAFHIGDGKCISFDVNGKWSEPIPWDDRCFLNKTTSICDTSALDEFRYCYAGDGTFPVAIFLASDGIDDSFGAEENMVNFYIQIIKSLIKNIKDDVEKEIQETLPELSKIGSKDDMSISMVYDKSQLEMIYPKLLDWQIETIRNLIRKQEKRIVDNQAKKEELEKVELTKKVRIEYTYAEAELEKAELEKSRLVKRINTLLEELYGADYTPYTSSESID